MISQTVRRGFAMLGILAVTAVTGIAVASPASARIQDGGRHPFGTTCFKDRILKKQANIYYLQKMPKGVFGPPAGNVYLGKVQLWYSPTCRIVFARLETAAKHRKGSAGNYLGIATVQRTTDNKKYTCLSANGDHACNTAMMNDARATSFVQGKIWYNGAFRTAKTTAW